MKKKQDISMPKDEPLEIPLPPPKMGSEEAELPKFADENPVDELTLPDLPDFDQAGDAGGVPEVPDLIQEETPARVQRTQEPKLPARIETPPVPGMETRIESPPELEMPALEEAHEKTPLKPKGQLFGGQEEARGEVFIKGDDYREILEGLDELLAARETPEAEKQERSALKADEKYTDRFEGIIEDLQRNLVVAEKTLFE